MDDTIEHFIYIYIYIFFIFIYIFFINFLKIQDHNSWLNARFFSFTFLKKEIRLKFWERTELEGGFIIVS
jgi:hypothetical protein